MSKKKNTITFNGKTYDARTGEVLYDASITKPSSQTHQTFQDVVSIDSRDSFQRGTIEPTKQRAARQHSTIDAHSVHSQNQKAITLMRQSVSKPAKKGGAKSINQAIFADTSPKQPVRQFDSTILSPRLERAQAVPKSNLVSRFGLAQTANVTKRTENLEVKKSPAHTQRQAYHDEVKAHHQSSFKQTKPDPVNDLFSQAIARADSHNQKLPTKFKRKHSTAKKLGFSALAINLAAILLIVVILGGFFRVQLTQQLAMNNVSKQSGISARLPSYRPDGFVMGNPSSPAPGQVVISFQSKKDDQSFTITQEQSSTDNDTLRNKVVSASQQDYQTYESNGHPIYLYKGANATWVNNGLEYKIEGSKSLSPDQVLRIAASF